MKLSPLSYIRKLWRKKFPLIKSVPRTFIAERTNAFFFNYDKRVVSGWQHGFKVEDRFNFRMASGKRAIFEIVSIEYMLDPKDQYFATVKDIGYEGDI